MEESNNLSNLTIDEEKAEALANITGATDLTECDSAISSNAYTQVSIFLVMIALYLLFRRRAPWVYYPNIKNKPQHPCYQENPGFMSWIYPLVTTKDTQLLSAVGLDGFMFLQTIKLLYRICFLISIFVAPLLSYCFYHLQNKNSQLFIRLSIWRLHDRNLHWGILIASYLVTLMIFYLIFIYYKRYVTLRQLYLAAPATMTSIPHMKRISKELGSDQNSVDYINVASRTVFIDRLPGTITNDEDLKTYIKQLNIGEVESVSLVHDTYYLQKLYEKRDVVIQNMEKEIAAAFNKVKKHVRDEEKNCRESFGDLYSHDIEKAASVLFENMRFTMREKVNILNEFMKYGDRFLSKSWMNNAILGIHLDKLKEVNNKILEEKERLQSLNKEEVIEVPQANETLFTDTDVRGDVSFFSLKQIANFGKNKDLFTLDLPINRRKAFITFKDQKTTGIVKQTKLGTRAFSSNTEPAPPPYDVLWKNITKAEVSGFFFGMISVGLYVLFNLAFLYIVVIIIDSLQVDKNTGNYVFKLVFGDKGGKARSLYQGILAPLIYNILLYFVPIIIKALIHMEDTHSYSGVQAKLMYRLSLFLFFNGFVATFICSLLLTFVKSLHKETVTVDILVTKFGQSIVKSSVFFLNTIVQRMCIGSAMVILKPAAFLYNFIIAPVAITTKRQEKERTFSPPIDFGNHIPNLLLIMPMALVYSCICPIVVVTAWVFYLFSYLVYKNEMLFATRNDYESGGSYWKPSISFLMLSVMAFQLSTAAITFSSGNAFIAYMFGPLIFISFICSQGINEIFDKSSENFPMNGPEEKFLDSFSKKVMQERHQMLSEWKEMDEEEDQDIIPISELGFADKASQLTESFYRDPSTLASIGNVMLPRNFFMVIHFIKSFDKNNEFRLKK